MTIRFIVEMFIKFKVHNVFLIGVSTRVFERVDLDLKYKSKISLFWVARVIKFQILLRSEIIFLIKKLLPLRTFDIQWFVNDRCIS